LPSALLVKSSLFDKVTLLKFTMFRLMIDSKTSEISNMFFVIGVPDRNPKFEILCRSLIFVCEFLNNYIRLSALSLNLWYFNIYDVSWNRRCRPSIKSLSWCREYFGQFSNWAWNSTSTWLWIVWSYLNTSFCENVGSMPSVQISNLNIRYLIWRNKKKIDIFEIKN
jgi:hypothetical protein